MIAVKNLTRQFGHLTAVDAVSFDIHPGDVVGFLGPNGAGKSTTMKMLTGFLTPTSGSIVIDEHTIGDESLAIKSKIGYLPEGAPAYGDMTVFQFLDFIASARKLKGAYKKERLKAVIGDLSLESVLNRHIDNLSKGFKRRVGLAQALVHDPKILILDEPTDGLDPNQKHQVRNLIKALAKDKIVIISTHILEEVTAVCNRVMVIAKGKIRFNGTPKAFQQQSRYYQAVTLSLSYAADISGLAELDGVAEMEIDKATGNVTLFPEPGHLILNAVAEHIQLRRLPVDELHVETGRLDDVFRQITCDEDGEGEAA
ncbi:ABC transporter ATP-binding protein [Alteromonas halophila]|uniref:ABC transporter ATP-binding protein n=1 Tax=Alteromonas halophila TaxID=516698 RepID=A0A918JMN8_9ALTE|nr:ATP-binding cassette domain-containing protein [Alteromonas halophila]GGW86342.1 ABC transporter ATP-binding protein [Alteromonas halophila]